MGFTISLARCTLVLLDREVDLWRDLLLTRLDSFTGRKIALVQPPVVSSVRQAVSRWR